MTFHVHKQTWSRKYITRGGLIPPLIAVAICYTLLYNVILINMTENDIDPDAACAADPGANDNASPHCSELQLFRDWHDAEVVSEEPSDASLLVEAVGLSAQSSSAAAAGGSATALRAKTLQEPEDVVRIEVDAGAAGERRQEQQSKSHHEQFQQNFDKLEKEVRASLMDHDSDTPWAKDLREQEKRAEEESQAHESHHEPSSESERSELSRWQGQVDLLDARIHTALHANSDAPWATDLLSLKHRLEAQMSYHMRRYAGHEEKVFELRHAQLDKLEEALHASPNSHFRTDWGKLGSTTFELAQMRVRLEFEMNTHTLKKRVSSSKAAIMDVSVASGAAHTQEQVSGDKSSAKKIVEKMSDVESGLADLVSDRFGHAPVVESSTSAPTGFLEKRLRWSSVTALSHSIVVGSAHDAKSLVAKKDLRHLQWSGSIPKVSCITAISYSRHTRARMMYFIDNFKLQDYEGPRQLVLVYHYLDSDAAELVQKYADGSNIKGVAARGGDLPSNADFPSNAALRYAAWAADADVIARWEFDDWHDPSRLSMQVRAMAATSRPASILANKLGFPDGVVVDKSLAGQRSWMKAYWKPFPTEGTDAEETASPPAAHIVELELRNLPSTGESSNIQSVAVTQKQTKVGAAPDTKDKVEAEKAHEWTVSECLDLDNVANLPQLTVDTETTIDKNLGHGMSQMFHKLMERRHDITQKLQLLCMETTMESDMKVHVFKRQHVQQMLSIRMDLDKHIAATVAIFTDEAQQSHSESLE